MIDEIDERGEPKRVREEDELLTGLIAHLPGRGEELYACKPFVLGEAHLLREGMKVTHERLDDLAEARIRCGLESRDHDISEAILGHRLRHSALPHLQPVFSP